MLNLLRNRNILIGLGIVILLLLSFWFAPGSRQNPSSSIPEEPENTFVEYKIDDDLTVSNQPKNGTTANLEERKGKVVALMPVYTDIFSIGYVEEDDKFSVTISQSPLEENKKKVIDWFKEQGFSNEDLERIKIEFSYPKFVN